MSIISLSEKYSFKVFYMNLLDNKKITINLLFMLFIFINLDENALSTETEDWYHRHPTLSCWATGTVVSSMTFYASSFFTSYLDSNSSYCDNSSSFQVVLPRIGFSIALGVASGFITSRYIEQVQLNDVVRHVKRTLTHGAHQFYPLNGDNIKAFFQRNWLKRWITNEAVFHSFYSKPASPIESFHSIVAKRLQKRAHNRKIECAVGLKGQDFFNGNGEPDHIRIDTELRKQIEDSGAFVKGQIIYFKGRTTFPINLINLRATNNNGVVYPMKYGLPLEHAFFANTLEQYCNESALLLEWGTYRDLSIISIPAGAFVNCRVGLIAPKTFPAISIRDINVGQNRALQVITNDPARIEDYQNFIDLQGIIGRTFPEERHGGNIQFLIGYASDYSVYDFGSLCIGGNGPTQYQIKDRGNGWNRLDPNSPIPIHFLDPNYLNTPLIIERILQDMDVLTADEYDQIRDFLIRIKLRQ